MTSTFTAVTVLAVLSAFVLVPRVQAAADEGVERKVYAHYMPWAPVGMGAVAHHARDAHRVLRRDLHERGGWPGDVRRDYGLSRPDRDLTAEESADVEIRRAMRIGIDGFAFDAWAGSRDQLEVMFKVAEEKGYAFELTVCIDPNVSGERGPLPHTEWVIKWLLEHYGDHPNLARRNGKPLIFGYHSGTPATQYQWDVMWRGELEGYPSGPEMRERDVPGEAQREKVRQAVQRLRSEDKPLAWRLAAEAWGSYLERVVGQPLYVHFCLNHFQLWEDRNDPASVARTVAALAEGVDAVGFFINHDDGLNRRVAEAADAAGIEWGYPIRLQYHNFTTSTFWGSPGTQWLRSGWRQAREDGSTLIQYITWNDYNEDTNLGPGWNSRYAYFDLTGYYIDWWKRGEQPPIERDRLYIFSRKYPHGAETWPFQSRADLEGRIEVVALLSEPGTIRVPGRGDNGADAEWEAPAGKSYRSFPVTPGPVSATLSRGGEVVIELAHPEPVTDRPFRQDLGITAISSEFERHWREDFGDDVEPWHYSEYGDADGDGLPDWFEMFYFGRFGDMTTATAAEADADSNDDGKTNLEHYLNRTDPTRSM